MGYWIATGEGDKSHVAETTGSRSARLPPRIRQRRCCPLVDAE